MARIEQGELPSVRQKHPKVSRWRQIFHRNGDNQPHAEAEITAATVERDLKEIQRGLISCSYGSRIAPELAEQILQILPSSAREIIGEGDLTVVPGSRLDSTDGRVLNGLSIRRALPIGAVHSGTNPSVLVHLTSTMQVESIDGIIPGEPKRTISDSHGRDSVADLHLLHTLASAVLTSRKTVS